MIPRSAAWIVGRLLPEQDREALLGDLVEEHALRTRADKYPNEFLWYWSQVTRSTAPLLWAAARRGRWLGILAAAIGVYIIVAMLESAGAALIAKFFASRSIVSLMFSMALSPALMVLGGYVAVRIRAGAAAILAIISAIAVIRLMITAGTSVAIAWLTIYLIACPLTALAGGALVRRRQTVRTP